MKYGISKKGLPQKISEEPKWFDYKQQYKLFDYCYTCKEVHPFWFFIGFYCILTRKSISKQTFYKKWVFYKTLNLKDDRIEKMHQSIVEDINQKQIQNKIAEKLRYQVKKSLPINNNIKIEKNNSKLLGCSAKFLKKYYESLFEPGMNWNNFGNKKGQWVTDHRTPLCMFDLTKKEEILRANHYTNLKPVWGCFNTLKGNRAETYLCEKCNQNKGFIHFYRTNLIEDKICKECYDKIEDNQKPLFLKHQERLKNRPVVNITPCNYDINDIKLKRKIRKISIDTREKIIKALNGQIQEEILELGCSLVDFKQYIQSLLPNNISINSTLYVLEYKTAPFSLNLTQAEELKKAFNYKNIYPKLKTAQNPSLETCLDRPVTLG